MDFLSCSKKEGGHTHVASSNWQVWREEEEHSCKDDINKGDLYRQKKNY